MTSQVFISYCTADRDAAEAIVAACEAHGIACWMAPRNIVAGTSWADAIIAGIAACSAVVLVHSAAANASPMVRREVDAAAAARKPIVPVRIDAALPQQGMQFYLSSSHWFDATPALGPHLPRLLETLRALLPAAAADGPRRAAKPATIPGFGDHKAIAVMPFRSYVEQDVPFSDGLTDGLINALSRWRSFPVIARDSVFALRDQARDPQAIGRALGVANLVSGSVRRHAARVRVDLELTDAATARTLLSEQYERTDGDPLQLQDELVRAIAGVLAPEVLKLEAERAVHHSSTDTSAYLLFEQGMWHRYRSTRLDLEQAEALFRAALDLDPVYARATAALSLCRNFAAINRWVDDIPAAFAESLSVARKAVAQDPRDPHAHFALGVACMNVRRLPEATAELLEAVRLNPSHAYAHANLGQVYNYLNRPDEALPEIELALRLNPHDPKRFMWLPYAAASHYLGRRYTACLAASEQALQANPNYPLALRYMAAALGQLGRKAEAAPLLPLILRVDKDLAGMESMVRRAFVPEAADHLLDGLRRAGLS